MLKNLVGRFTKDAVAQQALGTLKEIAVDTDKVPQFTEWLKSSNINSFSDNELEQTAFLAAEKQFLSDRKKQAKNLLFPIWKFILRGAMPLVRILYWQKFTLRNLNTIQLLNITKN